MADTWGFSVEIDIPYDVYTSSALDSLLPIGPLEPAHGFFLAEPQKAGGLLDNEWINLARWVPALKGRARVWKVSLISSCRCHVCGNDEYVPREWREARDRGYTVKVEWEALGEFRLLDNDLEVWGDPRDNSYGIPIRRG